MNRIKRYWKSYKKDRTIKATIEFVLIHTILALFVLWLLNTTHWLNAERIMEMPTLSIILLLIFILSFNHLICMITDKELYTEVMRKSY